ncbi:DEAD/DEAH box helicase [Mycoplasmatota bacterium WC44]
MNLREKFITYIKDNSYDHFFSRGERYYKQNRVEYLGSYELQSIQDFQFEVSGTNIYNVSIIKKDDDYQFYCDCAASREYSSLCKHQVASALHYKDYLINEFDVPNIVLLNNINKMKLRALGDISKVNLIPMIKLNSSKGIFSIGFTISNPKEPLQLKKLSSDKYFEHDKLYEINKPVKEFLNIVKLYESNNHYNSNDYSGSIWYPVDFDMLPFVKNLLCQVDGVFLSDKSKFDYLPIRITDETLPRITISSKMLEVKSDVTRITRNFSYSDKYFYINKDHLIFDLFENLNNVELNEVTLNKFLTEIYPTTDIEEFVTLDEDLKDKIQYVDVSDLELSKTDNSLIVEMNAEGIPICKDKKLQKLLALARTDNTYEFVDPKSIDEFLSRVKGHIDVDTEVLDLVKEMSDLIFLEFDFVDDSLYINLGLKKKSIKAFLESDHEYSHYSDGYISHKELKDYKEIFKLFHINKNTLSERIKISRVFVYSIFNSDNVFVKKAKKAKSVYELYDVILNHSFNDILPEGINANLRDYQEYGYQYLRMLDKFGFGGILADEMGLGKTLQVLTFIKSKQPLKKPVLIVTPTTVMYNWGKEIDKFIESINYEFVVGIKQQRRDILNELNNEVYITTYALLRNDIDLYKKIDFSYVFFDEAQYLKSVNAKVRIAAKSLKGAKFAITGTPIENSILELWSIMDIINPNSLGDFTNFKRTFYKKEEGLEILQDNVKNFILRRLKKDVLKELPDKVETEMYIELNKHQSKEYNKLIDEYSGEVTTSIKEFGLGKSYMTILSLLTRLRQVSCHPGLFLDDYDKGSTKLTALLEIIEEYILEGRKLIIFSQFKSMLDIIALELSSTDHLYEYLHGGIKQSLRQSIIDSYNNEDISIILISMKAGATGINLTKADTVIIFDPWWNPQLENQAIDRTHRIGQTKNVNVIRLIAKDTIEERIIEMQANKRRITETIIQESDNMLGSLNKDEILELFTKV